MQKELDLFTGSLLDEDISYPQLLLIIDTETTGLETETDQCIELGSILFHVESRSILAQNSFLIPSDSNSAESINKIPAKISRLPQPWQEGLKYFEHMLDRSDVVLAHNAAFDRKWFGIEPLPNIDKPWICSMEDISWPKDLHLKPRPSVRDLALAYEVPVWSAHRALTDCIYLAEVLRRCPDLEILLEQGLEPKRLMRALVTYEERNLAKQAGFRWNEPVRGAWTRRISDREITSLPFEVNEVEL